jgi:phospholipid/cholesterol/gamma-HCH transport system substrate-binding protein
VSAEAHYFRVGLFVLIGLAAILAFALLLGGRSWFQQPIIFETYFSESVQGLDVGSPVKRRGVKIGTVSTIGFVENYYPLANEEERLKYGGLVMVRMKTVLNPEEAPTEESLASSIRNGLRVRLSQAGLTGTAYIEAETLDPKRNPPMEIIWKPDHLYVPSALSTITQVKSSAERLLQRLDDLKLEELVASIEQLAQTMNRKVDALDVGALQRSVEQTLGETRGAVEDLRRTIREADVPGVTASLRDAVGEVGATIQQVQGRLEGGGDLQIALENLRIASENLRDATETARDYPASLLFGKPPPPTSLEGP